MNELRSEITTGMSAPPIGSTSVTPKTSAADQQQRPSRSPFAVAAGDGRGDDRAAKRAVHDLLAREDDRPPGKQLLELAERDHAARRRRSSRSAAENSIDDDLVPGRSSGDRRQARNSAAAIRAAAPPPTPLKIATICGIAVIGTMRAEATPMTVPIAIPATISR